MIRLAYWCAVAATLLAACGEDTENDSLPNVLTGISGLIIAAVLFWLLAKAIKKRSG